MQIADHLGKRVEYVHGVDVHASVAYVIRVLWYGTPFVPKILSLACNLLNANQTIEKGLES